MTLTPKDTPRISIGLTRPEMDELQQLAYRTSTSVSSLGHLAIRHLLIQTKSGALPMLPPVTAENTGLTEKQYTEDEKDARTRKLIEYTSQFDD